jgi:hypothetical protein
LRRRGRFGEPAVATPKGVVFRCSYRWPRFEPCCRKKLPVAALAPRRHHDRGTGSFRLAFCASKRATGTYSTAIRDLDWLPVARREKARWGGATGSDGLTVREVPRSDRCRTVTAAPSPSGGGVDEAHKRGLRKQYTGELRENWREGERDREADGRRAIVGVPLDEGSVGGGSKRRCSHEWCRRACDGSGRGGLRSRGRRSGFRRGAAAAGGYGAERHAVIGQGLPIYVALEPVDMRLGYQRLGGLPFTRRADPRNRRDAGGQRSHQRPMRAARRRLSEAGHLEFWP